MPSLSNTIGETRQLIGAIQELTDSLHLAEAQFDFPLYRDILVQAAETVHELRALVDVGDRALADHEFDPLVPVLSETLNRAEAEGEELVDYAFWRVIFLILIWAGGYVGGRILSARWQTNAG